MQGCSLPWTLDGVKVWRSAPARRRRPGRWARPCARPGRPSGRGFCMTPCPRTLDRIKRGRPAPARRRRPGRWARPCARTGRPSGRGFCMTPCPRTLDRVKRGRPAPARRRRPGRWARPCARPGQPPGRGSACCWSAPWPRACPPWPATGQGRPPQHAVNPGKPIRTAAGTPTASST